MLDRALIEAARGHRSQVRKGTDIPYIIHPVQVAWILDRHGYPEEVVVAGVLHDLLEDTDYDEGALREEFGDEVWRLVKAVTEVKVEGTAKRPWKVRKEEQIEHLRHAPPDEAALKAADALHNIRSVLNDLAVQGIAATMARFKASVAETLWYYTTVATLVRERLGEASDLAAELTEATAELQQKLQAAGS
jgi:(p)ppGpp synthase/HD superfamily hydrolase